MKDPWKVVAHADPNKDDTYVIEAGRGCTWLAVVWAAAALLGALGLVLRVFL